MLPIKNYPITFPHRPSLTHIILLFILRFISLSFVVKKIFKVNTKVEAVVGHLEPGPFLAKLNFVRIKCKHMTKFLQIN